MRTDIKWTADYEPQEGDRVTLYDGTVRDFIDGPTSLLHYARAIGSISRLVPDPEPPQGYRLATEEDRKGPKPERYATRDPERNIQWQLTSINESGWSKWMDNMEYAVPLPVPIEPQKPTSGVVKVGSMFFTGFDPGTEIIWATRESVVEGEVFRAARSFWVELPDFKSGDKVWIVRQPC